MPYYCLNANAQRTVRREHEVHDVTPGACNHLPLPSNRIDLGWHPNCQSAVAAARRQYPGRTIDGCEHCVPECHRF